MQRSPRVRLATNRRGGVRCRVGVFYRVGVSRHHHNGGGVALRAERANRVVDRVSIRRPAGSVWGHRTNAVNVELAEVTKSLHREINSGPSMKGEDKLKTGSKQTLLVQ